MPSEDHPATCGICGEPIDGSFEWAAKYHRRAAGLDRSDPIETSYEPTLRAHPGCVAANRAVYAPRPPLEPEREVRLGA